MSQEKFAKISIHAPTRGATSKSCIHQIISIFQSTLLQEERQFWHRIIKEIYLFQSTLLQEERLCVLSVKVHRFIFQSTLLQEERLALGEHGCTDCIFQSTLLQEERRWEQDLRLEALTISIHAPTRGATAKMHNNPYTYL